MKRKFIEWPEKERDDGHIRPPFLPVLPEMPPPAAIPEVPDILGARATPEELAALEERAVAAHHRYQAADRGKEIAKREAYSSTRELLLAINKWNEAGRYKKFLAEVERALGVSEGQANNYLRAARVAERNGALEGDPERRIDVVTRLAAVGRMVNSRDEKKRKYAEYLEKMVERGVPLPSAASMERSAREGDMQFFLSGGYESIDSGSMAAAYYNFLRTLALAGHADAMSAMTELLDTLHDRAKKGCGEISIRLSGEFRNIITGPVAADVVRQIEADIENVAREARKLGVEYEPQTASPEEKRTAPEMRNRKARARAAKGRLAPSVEPEFDLDEPDSPPAPPATINDDEILF